MLSAKGLFVKILNMLKGTAWANVPGKVGMNRLQYCTRSGICFINGYDNGSYSWPSGSWVTIGTLPSGVRPAVGVYASGGTRDNKTYEIIVNANGTIQLQQTGTFGWKSFSIAFPIG